MALLLVGMGVLSGLSSAVTQDTAFQQLQAAHFSFDSRTWNDTPCNQDATVCASQRRAEKRGVARFLAEQQRVAQRVGQLQSPAGAAAFGARFSALGAGAIAMALAAGLFIGGEVGRGTARLALSGRFSSGSTGLRRAGAVWVIGLCILFSAVIGALAAAAWGHQHRPLGASIGTFPATAATGAAAVMALYAVGFSWIAWRVGNPVRSLLLSVAAVTMVAVSTVVPFGPGRLAPAVVGIREILELEVGLVWVWPDLTFFADERSPVRIVEGPPWLVSILLVTAATGACAAALRHTLRTQHERT